MKRIVGRTACYLAAALALFFSIAPVFVYGVFGGGSILLLMAGIFFGVLPSLAGYLKRRGKKGTRLLRIILVLMTVGIIVSGSMTAMMFYTAHARGYDSSDPPKTVLVLGCQVRGTTPSLMLRRRLDTAYEYLMNYPDAVCVVSGGQGEDEEIPEGEAMEVYLIRKGISPERIYRETDSTNTKENFLYSTRIIEENFLSREIVVASDGFHQLRASMFAKDNGLAFHALPANTPLLLAPGYYAREWMGVVKSALFDRT